MRPDRDQFVSINYENIQPGARPNFDMVHSSNHSARNTPFDTSSVMMCGAHDFGMIDSSGRSKITVQPLKAGVDMRQGCILSFVEAFKINGHLHDMKYGMI